MLERMALDAEVDGGLWYIRVCSINQPANGISQASLFALARLDSSRYWPLYRHCGLSKIYVGPKTELDLLAMVDR